MNKLQAPTNNTSLWRRTIVSIKSLFQGKCSGQLTQLAEQACQQKNVPSALSYLHKIGRTNPDMVFKLKIKLLESVALEDRVEEVHMICNSIVLAESRYQQALMQVANKAFENRCFEAAMALGNSISFFNPLVAKSFSEKMRVNQDIQQKYLNKLKREGLTGPEMGRLLGTYSMKQLESAREELLRIQSEHMFNMLEYHLGEDQFLWIKIQAANVKRICMAAISILSAENPAALPREMAASFIRGIKGSDNGPFVSRLFEEVKQIHGDRTVLRELIGTMSLEMPKTEVLTPRMSAEEKIKATPTAVNPPKKEYSPAELRIMQTPTVLQIPEKNEKDK